MYQGISPNMNRIVETSKSLRPFFRRLLHTIFPTTCLACGAALWDDPIPFVCTTCWESVARLPHPQCPCCSRPFSSPVALAHSPTHRCGPCRKTPPSFTQAWTPYLYQTPLKEMIVAFKYHGKTRLARPLANLMLEGIPHVPKLDGILAVPLHRDRIRDRAYNQSLLLATQLGRALQIEVLHHTLIKSVATSPQTGLKRSARLKNLRNVFSVNHPVRIRGKRLLLIDDVLTTGTTVNECAKVLLKQGAQLVYVSTLARMV